jgi:hypothetical protein
MDNKNNEKLSDCIEREVQKRINERKPLTPDKFTYKEGELIIHEKDTKKRLD